MFKMIRRQRITLVFERTPPMHNLNEELQFFGSSLGLFNLRDKDRSSFRLFIELLKAAKADRPISSDELAFRLHLTRATIVHHLNKMIEAGLVIAEDNRYMLRSASLTELLDSLQKDFTQATEELKKVAKQIEEELEGN